MNELPKEFYFQQSDEQIVYSEMPSGGELDSDKLQQRDPKFWISRTLNEVSQPKSLILNDFFIQHRSEKQRQKLKQKLSELITQGFPLFLWQDGQLISLNQENLSILDDKKIQSKITPEYTNFILQNAVHDYHLTKDSILLLDDYWVNQLLSDTNTLPERALYDSLWRTLNETSKTKALQILSETKPKLTQFVNDVFPESEITFPEHLNIKRIKRYNSITINGKVLTKDINNDAVVEGVNVTIDSSCNNFMPLLSSFTSKIKSLNFISSSITATQLDELLKATPNLESLDLLYCTKLGTEPLSLKIGTLKKINFLNVHGSSITARQLIGLMEAAPNLESLDLSYCTNLGTEPFSLTEKHFNQIKSLNVSGSSITAKQLIELLSVTPNLESIRLSYCANLESLSFIRESLNKIKSLDVSTNSISATQLIELLKAAPNLESLNLSCCTNLGTKPFSITENRLDKIKFINASESSITATQLQDFLKAAPNLESLNLSSCTNLGTEPLSLTENHLSKIKSLDFRSSSITATQLQDFLKAAPNLESLDLSSCTNLGTELLSLTESRLTQIKSLNASGSSITAAQLQKILKAAPNLESLNLSSCTNLGVEPLSLTRRYLNKIKSLNFLGSSITTTQLKELLKAAPNLESLELSYCTNLGKDEALSLEGESLKKIKSINICGNSITAIELQELLKAAPNLQSLDLLSCTNLGTEPFSLTRESLKKITLLKTGGSSITATQLKELLEAAPHIEFLDLSSCAKLGTESLSLTKDSLKQLKSLNFSRNPITAAQLQELLKAAPNLESLDLSFCTNWSMESSLLKGERVKKITFLKISGSSITAIQLKELLEAAPNLESLELSSCTNLGTKPLSLTGETLKKIKSLNVSGSSITATQLNELLEKAPNLELISAINCKLINSEQLEEFEKAYPNIKFLRLRKSLLNPLSPSDPIHNPKEFHTITDKTAAKFQYHAPLTNNQNMIIAKFSQYLMSKDAKQYAALVQFMQKGICNALSHNFIRNSENFRLFFDRIIKWDPNTSPVPPKALQTDFNQLLKDVQKYQLQYRQNRVFIGENWLELIQTIQKPIVLSTAWHAIALKPPRPPATRWTIYDPNFVNGGPKEVPFAELKQTITNSIGHTNLQIEQGSINLSQIVIQNPNAFLSEGGLLTLTQSSNWNDILDQCREHVFTKEALSDGLFIRNTAGEPAWLVGSRHSSREVRDFTHKLLEDYKKSLGSNFEAAFKKSIEHLTPKQIIGKDDARIRPTESIKEDAIEDSTSDETPLAALIEEAKRIKDLQEWCGQYFKSQNSPSTPSNQLIPYCHELFSLTGNTLISCTSEEETRALQFQIHQQALHRSQPVYLINSPNDLLCSGNYIDEHGVLKKGPGGPLYDFLKANKENNPTLLVNYDTFKDSDYIHFNTLLDEPPSIDGVFFHQFFEDSVPNALKERKTQLRVIGFRNSANPNCYNETDFTSRMPHQRKAPLDIPPLPKPLPNAKSNPGDVAIDLFHTPYWKTELLGQWLPEGDGFRFKTGLLEEALKKDCHKLIVRNGMENSKEYKAFWQNALALGYITHQGRTIQLPKDLIVVEQQGYDWPSIKKSLSVTCYSGQGPGEVINPTRFNNLFKRYRCSNSQLNEYEGLIEEASNTESKVLSLNISRNLNEGQWAKLLTTAKDANLQLNLYLAEGVTPPKDLNFTSTPAEEKEPSQTDKIYLECSCAEAKKQIDALSLEEQKPVIITVSECQASDLIKRLSLKDTADSLNPTFQEEDGVLLKELNDGKTVILRGQILPPLMDELQALLNERRTTKARGQLILMPTTITPKDDLSVFKTLSNTPPTEISAEKFVQERIMACNEVLSRSPFVFLSGLSGVGKTSFVEKEFCGPGRHTLHHTLESWLAAQASNDGQYHILFIDEANLSKRDFSEFQDLYNHPPTFLYKGKIYPLDSEHKVVFAGNPLSYGEGRVLATLFQEHGNAIVLDPLPNSVIDERILSPIFMSSSLNPDAQQLIKEHILKVYNTLCKYSDTSILISPRELQMMALLTQSYCENFQEGSRPNPKEVITQFAYQLAEPLVPKQYQADFERFKPDTPLPHRVKPSNPPPQESSFCVTPSREPIEQSVNTLLLLREQRQKANEESSEALLYGGLGGLVLEGPPGVGKSELLTHLLRSWGLKEAHLLTKEQQSNCFYRIPANFSIKQKKELLLKAFHEGAVVIMDEHNSSPMMEQFLNHLLMGKDDNGNSPQKPGFLLLGTQNPATLSGRRHASEALSRRLMCIQVPEYPVHELIKILETKKVPYDEASVMAQQWKQAYDGAQSKHQNPPTFRDLIHMAKFWNEAKKKVQDERINFVQRLYKSRESDLKFQEYLTQLKSRPITDEDYAKLEKINQLNNIVSTIYSNLITKTSNPTWLHQRFFASGLQKAHAILETYQNIPVKDRLKLLDYNISKMTQNNSEINAFLTKLNQKRFVLDVQSSHSSREFKKHLTQLKELGLNKEAEELSPSIKKNP